MLWTNPAPGTVAFGDAVVITSLCGALMVFWLRRNRPELGQPPMVPGLRAKWRRIPQAMRRAIGSTCLCALVGGGLAVILNIADH